MTIDWQIVVVGVAVAWAVSVVGRQLYRSFLAPAVNGCGSGGCGACPSNSTRSSSGLVQIQMPEIHSTKSSV